MKILLAVLVLLALVSPVQAKPYPHSVLFKMQAQQHEQLIFDSGSIIITNSDEVKDGKDKISLVPLPSNFPWICVASRPVIAKNGTLVAAFSCALGKGPRVTIRTNCDPQKPDNGASAGDLSDGVNDDWDLGLFVVCETI